VVAALDGGFLAIIAGVAVVLISWAVVPLLSRGSKINEVLEIDANGGVQGVRNTR
jgi:hypothetical protein